MTVTATPAGRRRLALGAPLLLAAMAVVLTLANLGPLGSSGSAAPSDALRAEAAAAIRPVPVPVRRASPGHGFSPGWKILWGSDAELAADMDGMAATGVSWVRIDFDWASVERERGRYSWGPVDRAVSAAHRRGFRVLALPTYTPTWARAAGTTDKHPPLDPADFARFVGAAVARYAPKGVAHWEIWNEANSISFWKPKPDPRAYGRLLDAAAAAVRKTDSEATVLTSGTAPAADSLDGSTVAPTTFLASLYRDGLGHTFDAVAHHPYSYPVRPLDRSPQNAFLATTDALRQIMVANGDEAKKLWGTEFGVPVGRARRAVSEADQASHLVEAYDAWLALPYTGPLFWYNWRDTGTDPQDLEQNFGLVREDQGPKPALAAMRDHVARWCTAGPTRCLRTSP